MTLLEKIKEVERLLGEGGWTEEMYLVDEGVEILELLGSIYEDIVKLDMRAKTLH